VYSYLERPQNALETKFGRDMKKGTVVRIKKRWRDNSGEKGKLFVVVEDRGDRILIQAKDTGLPFPPQELVKTNMVEIVG
jgi:hypothetical protein